MSIQDIKKDFTLVSKWNDVIEAQSQSQVWASIVLNKITTILADPNFLLNASAQESLFVNNLQSYIQNFISQMPSNPNLIL